MDADELLGRLSDKEQLNVSDAPELLQLLQAITEPFLPAHGAVPGASPRVNDVRSTGNGARCGRGHNSNRRTNSTPQDSDRSTMFDLSSRSDFPPMDAIDRSKSSER